MPASALYLTAESVSRMSSQRGSRAESDTWRAKRGNVGLGVDADVVVCTGRRLAELVTCDGGSCTLSGRRRRGTGGGDGWWLTDLDRPNRGGEDEEVPTGAELLAYSGRVVLRFGCTGGGRSVVGREGDGERDLERVLERVRNGERERLREPGATRLAPATCSNERVEVTDAGGLARLRGGNTGIVATAPSKEERELPLSIPSRFGGLTPPVELLRTCKTRSCSRCASIRFAS
jgi:hypothetical protein